MIRHSSGIICLPDDRGASRRARPADDGAHNTDVRRTAFTVSVDARQGTTTGISAADRWRTIQA